VQATQAANQQSVRVIDGDTIDVSGQRIRIHGIDAPEGRQTCLRGGVEWLCGQEAAKAIRVMIRGSEVTCQTIDKDRYGRLVSKYYADGKDLGGALVEQGLALAYRRHSKDYTGAEATAKAAQGGLWSGEFVAPWDWQRGKRLVDTPANHNGDCAIKGNISRSGERIYHVPEGCYYARTKISRAKGERMFCSEDEAREAGWRRSRR